MEKNVGSLKIIAAVVSFFLIAGFAIFKMDYQDFSISNNLWQYIAIAIALIGCIGVFFFNNSSASFRKKGSFVVWLLAILFFIYIVISSITTRVFDWKFWLIAVLLLLSTTLSFRENNKKE